MSIKPRVDPQLYKYVFDNPDLYASTNAQLKTEKSVLVIEDDALLRQVVVHKLRKAGYFVLESVDGSDALKQLQRHSKPMDLVLTDIIMPGMNGREVVAEIRRLQPTIAVLYMSGYPSDIVTIRGQLEPGIDFLEKAEVMGDGLINKIREILNRTS